MNDDTSLPDAAAVGEDGHLTEMALTALADGEEGIVPSIAHAHLNTCAACMQALGEAALLASAVDHALVPAEPPLAVTAFELRARDVPVRALLVAAALTVLGLVPAFASLATPTDVVSGLETARSLAAPLAFGLLELGRALVGRASLGASAVLVAASMVLVLAGVTVARVAPRKLATTEGRRV